MNNINANQNQESNIEIAAAFRQAYRNAKLGKAAIWTSTAILSALQLIAASKPQLISPDLEIILPSLLVATTLTVILASTIGKHLIVNRFLKIGSSFQRLHDFNVLGLGTKPSHQEALPSKIQRYSRAWLANNPSDRVNLSEWWSPSVSTVPHEIGACIALLSTFNWELELRKKYSTIILGLGLFTLAASLVLMDIQERLLPEYIVLTLLPITPIFSLIIDEYLDNRNGIETATNAVTQATSLLSNSSTPDSRLELEQLMYNWSHYRTGASPLFDWLYWITQKAMNQDMMIDTESLANEYSGS